MRKRGIGKEEVKCRERKGVWVGRRKEGGCETGVVRLVEDRWSDWKKFYYGRMVRAFSLERIAKKFSQIIGPSLLCTKAGRFYTPAFVQKVERSKKAIFFEKTY